MNPRLLVILDVDETLIYASDHPLTDSPDFTVGRYSVARRPHLGEFIDRVCSFADVAVWSSASDDYVSDVVRNVFPSPSVLRFCWGRSRCTRRFDPERYAEYWVKDLKKVKRLGYSLDRMLMVDDSPEKIERQYGNHIRVDPFCGSSFDAVLPPLADYLASFAEVVDVRPIEKRGWMDRRRKAAQPGATDNPDGAQ